MDTDGVGDAIVQVADDAKAYAGAQLALYKTLALARWQYARGGLVFGGVAAVLGLAALMGLVVGLILSLAPVLGPLGATAVVVVIVSIVAGALGWIAAKRFAAAFGEIG